MRAAAGVGDMSERHFAVVEVPLPEPLEGQLRIGVHASALNRGELMPHGVGPPPLCRTSHNRVGSSSQGKSSRSEQP